MKRTAWQMCRIDKAGNFTRLWPPRQSWIAHQWELHVQGWVDLWRILRGTSTDRVASIKLTLDNPNL